MAEKFNVVICVTSSAKLATIMQVLDGEAKLIKVDQVEEEPAKRRKRATREPLVRHNEPGTRAVDITLDLAKGGGELTTETVEKTLAAKGFSRNSAAPRLSELVKNGQLTMIRRGVYKITPTKSK